MFKLDRSCPLKLRPLSPYPAIEDPCVGSSQLYRKIRQTGENELASA